MSSHLVRIDGPDDPRIEPYRRLRERDLVREGGGFIAEGEVVLTKLVRAGRHRLTSLLIADRRVDRLDLLIQALSPTTPVYVAPQEVLDGICGFSLHRGVLGLGETPRLAPASDLLRTLGPRALVLAALGIGNHDNMGGLFRNAAAFGIDAVLLDAHCCEPLYRKAIRVSVGAVLTTRYARLAQGEDLIGMLKGCGFEVMAMTPLATLPLVAVTRSDRTAVLFGSEGPGLSPDILARARCVAITMANGFDSLNVATASGIVLHHLTTTEARRSGSSGPG